MKILQRPFFLGFGIVKDSRGSRSLFIVRNLPFFMVAFAVRAGLGIIYSPFEDEESQKNFFTTYPARKRRNSAQAFLDGMIRNVRGITSLEIRSNTIFELSGLQELISLRYLTLFAPIRANVDLSMNVELRELQILKAGSARVTGLGDLPNLNVLAIKSPSPGLLVRLPKSAIELSLTGPFSIDVLGEIPSNVHYLTITSLREIDFMNFGKPNGLRVLELSKIKSFKNADLIGSILPELQKLSLRRLALQLRVDLVLATGPGIEVVQDLGPFGTPLFQELLDETRTRADHGA
jgi:hypothetical protein